LIEAKICITASTNAAASVHLRRHAADCHSEFRQPNLHLEETAMQETPKSEEQAGEVFERFGAFQFFQTLSGIPELSFLSNGLLAILLTETR
jgi:hypothetical protein